MPMLQRALTAVVALLLLGTIWAFEQASAWVDVLAPAAIAAGLVQVGLTVKDLRARRS